jgi:hypothetical protein
VNTLSDYREKYVCEISIWRVISRSQAHFCKLSDSTAYSRRGLGQSGPNNHTEPKRSKLYNRGKSRGYRMPSHRWTMRTQGLQNGQHFFKMRLRWMFYVNYQRLHCTLIFFYHHLGPFRSIFWYPDNRTFNLFVFFPEILTYFCKEIKIFLLEKEQWFCTPLRVKSRKM